MTLSSTPFPYQAVIFDLDGVLADTEPMNFRAIQDMFDPAEVLLDEEDYHAVYGLDYYDTAAHLRRRYQLTEPVESLVKRQQACAVRRIEQELEPAPGALAFIHALAARSIPLGLASNSPSLYVTGALRRLTLEASIPYPVGRDDVANGKPAPDPYLAACARLRVDPVHCLAVEDSAVGMQSALAAGLFVALVGPHAPLPPAARGMRFPDIPHLAAHFQLA